MTVITILRNFFKKRVREGMSIHRRQNKNGISYEVKLRDHSGRMHSRTFKTQREAKAFESEELASRRRGTWVDSRSSEMSFADLADRWLKAGNQKRYKSLERDRSIINNHLLPKLGSYSIGNIRSSDIQELVNSWVTQGLAPRTIARHKAVLSAIFNMALNDDLIGRTPVRGIRIPRFEAINARVLTPEESKRLLSVLDEDNFVIVYFLLTTGMRWSELAGLTIRHLNLLSTHPFLSIEQGAHETGEGIRIERTKSVASTRKIFITEEQVLILSKYLSRSSRTGSNPDAPLFVSPKGRVLAYKNFNSRVWHPAVRAADLEGLKIHDLRKTAATNLLRAGVDHKTLMAMMGHEDIRTTLEHYARTSPESLQQASFFLVSTVNSVEPPFRQDGQSGGTLSANIV